LSTIADDAEPPAIAITSPGADAGWDVVNKSVRDIEICDNGEEDTEYVAKD